MIHSDGAYEWRYAYATRGSWRARWPLVCRSGVWSAPSAFRLVPKEFVEAEELRSYLERPRCIQPPCSIERRASTFVNTTKLLHHSAEGRTD